VDDRHLSRDDSLNVYKHVGKCNCDKENATRFARPIWEIYGIVQPAAAVYC
jgi:hypothetical protein